MTSRLVFTVDLDRDVNFPMEGCREARSLDRGGGTSPRFSSAERGLRILMDILDEIGMKATFFVEGRTSETIDCSSISGHCIGFHGYDHEDLTGASTGISYSDTDLTSILRRGFDAVKDNISRPTCFRAPYMACDDRVLEAVSSLGIFHDSSSYSEPGSRPYLVHSGVTEHPVPKGRDTSGRNIASYLWPMHEGKRVPEDYIRFASCCMDTDFIIATHTWHMVERRDGGIMDEDAIEANSNNVREVLTGILDSGFDQGTICRSR